MFIDDGKIVGQAPPAAFLAAAKSERARDFVDKITHHWGGEDDPEDAGPLLALVFILAGAGIKDGDAQFAESVDGVSAEYRSGGGWAEAYEKWVAQYTDEPQDPPTMTLQEALEVTS